MCQMCDAPKRYLPSVGDLEVIDAIDRRLGVGHSAAVFRRWRRWHQAGHDRADREEREATNLAGKLADAEEMCTRLRERLAKADQTITADMDIALRLLPQAVHPGDRGMDYEQLYQILTSVRKRYGPETKTSKPD